MIQVMLRQIPCKAAHFLKIRFPLIRMMTEKRIGMNDKDKIAVSRFMSLILRHQPQRIGLTLDPHGWADTDSLIEGINNAGYNISLEDIKDIVATNNKQRFKFSDDHSKIRANQGHSINVDVELKESAPPDFLYHGTASRFLESIQKDGIKARSRLYVHLSADKQTAVNVGKRHGTPVVLTVSSSSMYTDGFKFYLSDNNVWLTDFVPVKYIIYGSEDGDIMEQ